MLGKRSDQRGLWEADRLYLDHVGKDTFYGLLASLRGQLFSAALLLQTCDKASDAETKARDDFDILTWAPGSCFVAALGRSKIICPPPETGT